MKRLYLLFLFFFSATALADANPDLWPYTKELLFGERLVEDADTSELSISGPARASSGAQVPVTLAVDTERFVRLYLIIDANPHQHAGTFYLTEYTKKTEISTRIRMETDSFVRVVGETADGELFMHAVAIRASGGCSGYMDVHDPELTKDLGKILYKKKNNEQVTRIKHPMFTGLQKDLDSGGYIPEWTIKTITWQDSDKVILKAVTNISISQDPYIKFLYDGDVTVTATDTKGNEFIQ